MGGSQAKTAPEKERLSVCVAVLASKVNMKVVEGVGGYQLPQSHGELV